MVLHVKYPSMERQDLSQGQLGAFKFTPVDEVTHISPQPQPHPLLLQQYAQSFQNAALDQRVKSPHLTTDLTFFNQQVRPLLNASRLHPVTEGVPLSPRKRRGNNKPDSMQPMAPAFRPALYSSSENDSNPSMYTSEMSSAPLSDGSTLTSSMGSNASLLRALEAEQDAHEATKTQLDNEIHARLEAEAETLRLADHNKGLLNSIKLLQSTVKHMVQKYNNPEATTQDAVEDAVKEYNRQAKESKVNGSILYDVMSNYRNRVIDVPSKEASQTSNMDLLSSPDKDDRSHEAELQRTLRSQVGLATSTQQEHGGTKKDLNAEYREKIQAIVRGDIKPGTEAQTSPPDINTHTDGAAAAPVIQPQVEHVPMLELPAAFRDKYVTGRKPKSSPASSQAPSPITPRKANLTVAAAIKAKDFDKENRPGQKVIHMPDTFAIDWKVDGRHINELRGQYSETKTENYFRDFPIRYVPRLSDENLYRTVMIDFIPFGTPYGDLLAQIRGGTLESVQMYGPIGNATDFVTARVIFTDETGATGLYARGQDPGIFIHGQQVRVWQVLEPTYPKNKELEEAIYVNGHTRILVVNAPIDDIEKVLKRRLRHQIEAGLVLDIGRTHDGVPMVEFTSIEEATKALNQLLCDREFGGSDFDFEEDYCATKYA